MIQSLLALFFVLALGGCNPSSSSFSSQTSEESKSEEKAPPARIENPYSQGTGHYAGFEWAERTGGGCSGNSHSFNEGCEEYLRQARASR